MITLDTSAIFALLNRQDPDHKRVEGVFVADAGPHLVPAGILAEIANLAERRLAQKLLWLFRKISSPAPWQ